MSLTVGTDSYISLEDADLYLNKYHLSTEDNMVAWAALSDEHSEILLRKAARLIDSLPLAGLKAESSQVMQFPRALFTQYGGLTSSIYKYGDDYYVQTSVPDEIGYAQAEIALDMVNGVTSDRVKLQREGVRSYSIGHLSETLVGIGKNPLPIEAERILAPYIAGGVSIV